MKALPLLLLTCTTWKVASPFSIRMSSSTVTCKAPTTLVEPDTTFISPRWENRDFIHAHGSYDDEAFLEDPTTPLYQHQSSLQKLPIPSLEETIKRLSPTALPLAENEKEKDSWIQACKSFPQEAQFLQERLEERRSTTPNWLQEWWNVDSYLSVRTPLVIFSSYCFHLPLPTNLNLSNIQLAAACLQATAEFAQTVKNGSKLPDAMGRNGQKLLCSAPYKYMFHTSRIAKPKRDVYRIYNPFQYSHVIVACRGHFYKVPVENASGKALPRATLEALLVECVAQSEQQQQEALDMGYLTTLPRDEWARVREDLEEMGFESALQEMDSGMLVLNLDLCDGDEKSPTWLDDVLEYWHGGGSDTYSKNRWYDKSINLIITQNGKLGLVGEHSMMDGLPVAVLCEHILDKVGRKESEDYLSGKPSIDSDLAVKDIFQDTCASLATKERNKLANYVEQAKSDFTNLASQYDLQILHYTGYGEQVLKKAGMSSDAFVQMAMQLASFRLYGKPVSTYESTQVRTFYQGRTETTRTVSPSSLEFVQAMDDKSVSLETKLALLKKAAYAHSKYSSKAARGLGVDRHLFGLSKCLKEGETLPALFSHPLYQRSKEWQLSTSQLSTVTPAFGQAIDNGVGIGYTLHPNGFIFFITDHGTNIAEQMCQRTREALDEMKQLLDAVPDSK